MVDIEYTYILAFLTRYRSNALTVQTGPDGQIIPRLIDVLINEKCVFVSCFCECQYLYVLRQ